MSTVTRNRLAPVVAGLIVSLLAQQASATEEIVVYGSAASAVKVDPAVFRAEIDNYIRTLNSELRTTLDQDLKRMSAPKLELASNRTPARG
jgi:regulator of sirC expression with transglutaminase-like and TPR domain